MLEKDIAKYSSKIYRKLYLYALIIMVTSIVITTTIVGLFFKYNEKKMFDNHTIKNAQAIKKTINGMIKIIDKNTFIPNKKITISERPEQIVEYIPNLETLKSKSGIPQEIKDNFIKTHQPQAFALKNETYSGAVLYINDKNRDAGIIFLEMPRGRKNDFNKFDKKPPHPPRPDPLLITGFSILVLLAILLIPFSVYLFKPFQQLMSSINKVSEGDFKTLIVVSKKSDFKGIADSFNNMTMKIHEMIIQRDRLIADVSHELRTPLTRMRLALELLDKEGKGKKKYIDKSINEIEHLDKLIEDLLDASKLELNKSNFLFEKTSLKKIINENIENNNLIFTENALKINFEYPEKDVIVKIESHLFERALSNIFSNLAKYAPYESKVDILVKIDNQKAMITIRDRGEGVRDDELDKIFEPFYRADSSRSRRTGGTGLGLSIVKQIISLHDGFIVAEKSLDNENGLSIKITLNIFGEA